MQTAGGRGLGNFQHQKSESKESSLHKSKARLAMQTMIIIFSHVSQENGVMRPSNFEGKINYNIER